MILGHKTVETTFRYLHTSGPQRAKAKTARSYNRIWKSGQTRLVLASIACRLRGNIRVNFAKIRLATRDPLVIPSRCGRRHKS